MKKWIPAAGSVLLTLLAVVIAVVVSLHLWDYYMEAPWTRDGHVHADMGACRDKGKFHSLPL
ncbi:p-hydroxybenzoic acid efflux subunit AaeA [Stutzerimonas frequens]|nr:hypothetical protein A3710_06385 [Stutzerimonas frequens]QFU12493.1 p-hydroxybenzoic acid efflux subunit AaeA [Stutzerimonas frequens]